MRAEMPNLYRVRELEGGCNVGPTRLHKNHRREAAMENIVFTREAAMLIAQIGPVLVIAFIVEFRAIAERRSVEGRDVRSFVWIVFVSLTVLLAVCLTVVNSEDDWRGQAAISAWVFVLVPLAVLLLYVAMAAWAAVQVATRDADDERMRSDALDQRLRLPGWRWFFRSQPAPLHVVAAVIERDGMILACRRGPSKSGAGEWEFPGGKIERAEQPAEALIREIKEELGVRVRIVEPLTSEVTDVDGVALRLSCFKVKVIGQHPTSSSDHDELRWVRRAELLSLNWASPDLPAVHALIKEGQRTHRRRPGRA